MQELLLKDLPDPSQARRYSRRPSMNEAPTSNGSCSGKAGNVVESVGADLSQEGWCPNIDDARDRPRVVVEGLSAAWENGEASNTQMSLEYCVTLFMWFFVCKEWREADLEEYLL